MKKVVVSNAYKRYCEVGKQDVWNVVLPFSELKNFVQALDVFTDIEHHCFSFKTDFITQEVLFGCDYKSNMAGLSVSTVDPALGYDTFDWNNEADVDFREHILAEGPKLFYRFLKESCIVENKFFGSCSGVVPFSDVLRIL